MTDSDLMCFLKSSKILREISDDDIKKIVLNGNVLNFRKGDILIREKQQNHGLFIILTGKVEVFLPETANGATKIRATRAKLARLSSGDCIGEYSLIDNNPASASVLAIEPCEVFEISKENFEVLIDENDRMGKKIYRNMLDVLVKRARQYDEELDMLNILSI